MGCGGSKTSGTTPRKGPVRRAQGGNKGKGGPSRNKQVPINEKGYKKRIRENLRHATAESDVQELEKAMEIFVNNHLEDGGDYEAAERRMEFLLLRKEIRDACMRKHPVVLERAIQKVESSQYKRQLKAYLDRAYYLKQHQNEPDTFKHDISDLEQSTISEIRSYHHPPPGVHETMIATYMILGYPENHLIDWTEITALMGRYGKDSLIREVSQADQKKIDNSTGLRARNYLNQYTLEEVRSVSNGAAAFYVWSSKMVGKYDSKKGASTPLKTLRNSGGKGQTPSAKGSQGPATPTNQNKPNTVNKDPKTNTTKNPKAGQKDNKTNKPVANNTTGTKQPSKSTTKKG